MEPTTPRFLIQLQVLLSENPDYIVWMNDGTSFTIIDQAGFTNNVLSRYFKHNQMASFVRQLNMYGFKKVLRVHNSDIISFHHPYFQRNNYELMENIKRKTPANDKISNEMVNSLTDQVKMLQISNTKVIEEVEHYRQENEILKKQVKMHQEKVNQHEAYLKKMYNLMLYFKNIYPKMFIRDGVTSNQPLMIADNGSQQNKLLTPKLVSPGSSEKLQSLPFSSTLLPPIKVDNKFHPSLSNTQQFLQQDANASNSLISFNDPSPETNKNILALSSQPHNFEGEIFNQTKRKRPKLTPVRFLKPSPNRKVDRILNVRPTKADYFEKSKPESSNEHNLAAVSSFDSLPNLNSLNDEFSYSVSNDNNNTAYFDDLDCNTNVTTNLGQFDFDEMETNEPWINKTDSQHMFIDDNSINLLNDYPLNSNENDGEAAINDLFDQLTDNSTQPSHNTNKK